MFNQSISYVLIQCWKVLQICLLSQKIYEEKINDNISLFNNSQYYKQTRCTGYYRVLFRTQSNILNGALLRKKCPYSKLFWSAFSRIWTECREILRISPYSVRMQENAGQTNSEYGHFLCSAFYKNSCGFWLFLAKSYILDIWLLSEYTFALKWMLNSLR